ncbi:MAG: hypothetical protein Q9M20_08820 [Mariprofundaceae bacterium]|nr:hypothetical protein [Mariprofundaceae bacterium]
MNAKPQGKSAQKTKQQIINDGIDTASLAMIYHEQASALFNAIQALASDSKHKTTIIGLCSIGYLISDDAGNAANCSQEALQAGGEA